MRALFICTLIALAQIASAQSGKKFISKLHKTYAGNWPATFSFQQETKGYRNDSLVSTSIWTEAIEYPAKFRMDIGPLENGNAMLYVNDSSYRFSKGKLVRTAKDENDLIFLLGGMYFYSKESMLEKLAALNYDLSKSYKTKWQGKDVIVVGANNSDENVNQLWFEKDRKVLVRMFKYEDNRKQEVQFDKHVNLIGKTWIETDVKIFINDKLVQTEAYFNLLANPILHQNTFNPEKFAESKN